MDKKPSATLFQLFIFIIIIIWNLSEVNSQQRGSNRYNNNNYRNQTGAFGNECITPCSNRGKNGEIYEYYFCYTAGTLPGQNWDYCSPRCGTDSNAKYCEGPCTKGMRYTYCYTDNAGTWGYCGTYPNGNCGRGGGYNNYNGRDRNRNNRGRDGYQNGRGYNRHHNNNYYNNRGGYRGGRDNNGRNRDYRGDRGRDRDRGRGGRG